MVCKVHGPPYQKTGGWKNLSFSAPFDVMFEKFVDESHGRTRIRKKQHDLKTNGPRPI